ncbi:MAG: hypothetical protein BWY97_01470 [Tenericutes bacterium ADurb.BinA124]|nr:MAG: hypothetical protein BWY97_01470 [Tenericutes bacterium ADurb.BinA124]
MVNTMIKHKKSISHLDFVVLLLLFLSGSFLTSNDIIPPTITKIIWIVLGAMVIFKFKTAAFSQIVIPAVLCIFVFLSTLVNQGNLLTSLFICIQVVIISIIICGYGYRSIFNSYSKVMVFLCAFSLIMTCVFLLFPVLNNLFRVSNINNTATFSNFIFFVKNNNEYGLGRNCGMFWEPGAFQTFICFAMILEITKKKINLFRIILFSITIISTFSTTGYFALILIYVFLLFKTYENNKQVKLYIVGVFAIVAVLLITNYEYFFSTSGYTVFGKLLLYRDSSAYHNRVSSVSIRISAVIEPIFIFFRNPVFGVGDVAFRELLYESTLGVTSCTLLNWFAIYGIVPGLIIVFGIIKLTNKLSNKVFARILLFAIIFVVTMSENFISNAAITMFFISTLGEKKFSFKATATYDYNYKSEMVK